MEQLRIYSKDESEFLELPKTAITAGSELVYKEIEMAAGNLVQYIQGHRPTISATWSYFPSALLAQVTNLTRQGGWFKVEYPDLDGQDKVGYFKVTPSTMGTFTFENGKPFWKDLTLTFVSREVVV